MSNASTVRISTAGIAQREKKFFVALRKCGTSIGESWEFPGGKNRDGETPQETLVREYQEELSVSIEVGELLYEGNFHNRGKSYRLLAYAITFVDAQPEYELIDHQMIAWKSINELRTMPMAESDRAIAQSLADSPCRA